MEIVQSEEDIQEVIRESMMIHLEEEEALKVGASLDQDHLGRSQDQADQRSPEETEIEETREIMTVDPIVNLMRNNMNQDRVLNMIRDLIIPTQNPKEDLHHQMIRKKEISTEKEIIMIRKEEVEITAINLIHQEIKISLVQTKTKTRKEGSNSTMNLMNIRRVFNEK